ncbi:hypothetical protein E2C01_101121 [Portunus trituberculatus]|uniref:Uncharacterized protein n=1 Tax=Portunus trituberculatus TaxID=210409 RepID=A0A5B7K8R5_PORTR|nr:hypothetical protein [Portunus trituberculatus]
MQCRRKLSRAAGCQWVRAPNDNLQRPHTGAKDLAGLQKTSNGLHPHLPRPGLPSWAIIA